MQNKAIFLDRDGTINIDKHYLYRIEDFEFVPGTLKGLRMLYEAGYKLILITNQSGIARGYFSEEDYQTLNSWLQQRLVENNSPLTASYYCPHLPDANIVEYKMNCECRKPKLGLFMKAVKDWDIDLSLSYAIGDRLRDCSICNSSNCQGFLVGNTEDNQDIEKVKSCEIKNIRYAQDLLQAANIICGLVNNR